MQTPSTWKKLLATAGLLCAFSSAQAEGTSPVEYAQARQQWLATGLHDYQFTLLQTCFCMGENSGAMRISVKNHAVESAIWLNNGAAVSAEGLKQVPSIDTIFQQIDAGYARPAEEIQLILNKEYGYPERVFIDYYKRMADEELIYTLSDFSR